VSETFDPRLIAIGLVLCLFGWTLYWAGLHLVGAVLGAITAAGIAAAALVFTDNDRWLLAGSLLAALGGAFAGVFLIKRAHYLLFFVLGAVLGLATAWSVDAYYGDWLRAHLPGQAGRAFYFGAFSLVGGLVFLVLNRIVIIIMTSLAGSTLFALGLPSRYAIWLFLPLLFGSLLLQTGVLAALGEPAVRAAGYEEDEED